MRDLILSIFIGITLCSGAQTMDLQKRITSFPEMTDLLFVDFDQDGDEDVIGIEGSNLKFYIKDSLANFTLSSSSFTIVGNRLVSEDFNLDGFPDVLVHGMAQQKVYLSNGNGTFNASSVYDIVVSGGKDYLDMDGDGDLDMVLNNNHIFQTDPNEIKVYENLNSSGFSAGNTIFQNSDSLKTHSIGLGDFNHDGINDIMRKGLNPVNFEEKTEYYLGSSGFNFTLNSSFTTNLEYSLSYNMADFNNDGYDDVLSGSNILLYDSTLNNYLASDTIVIWQIGTYQEIIDVNNDGFLDIFVNKVGSQNSININTFEVYINSGTGTFNPLNTNISNFYKNIGQGFDVSDIDNDGDFDILFNGNYQYHNNGSDEYGISSPKALSLQYDALINYEFSSYRDGFDFADVDKDGDLDLIQIGESGFHTANTTVFENIGGESTRYVFEEKPMVLTDFLSGKCVLADMNGDENIDVLAYGPNPFYNKVEYAIGSSFDFGNAHLTNSTIYTNSANLSTANLNNDSLEDIVFQSIDPVGHLLEFKIQSDSLTFESSTINPVSYEGDYQFFDLDNDGDDDLIIGGGVRPDLTTNVFAQFYENDGTGQFTEVLNVFPSDLQMNNIQFGDVDLDGDIDIYAASSGFYPHFNILKQEAGMVFSYDTLISNIPQVNFEFDIADIDGDSDLDIGIMPLAANSTFQMFINESNDFVELPINGVLNTFTKGFVKFLDMNGDNILDVFMADSDKVEFYMNSLCQATIHHEPASGCNEFISPYTGSVFTESGEYLETLTQLNVNGCDSIVKWDLTIYSSSMDTLNIESCLPYNSPNSTDIWEESGFYLDTMVNTLGCDSVVVYNLTINTINTNISTNGNNQLVTNNNIDELQWLDCNNDYAPITGATSQVFAPSTDGSYALEFSNGLCKDTSECLVINSIGINPLSELERSSFPNPFRDILNIIAEDKTSAIWITDMAGKTFWKKTVSNQEQQIQISTAEWDSGIYLIHIQNGNITGTKKTLKI